MDKADEAYNEIMRRVKEIKIMSLICMYIKSIWG